MKTRTLSIAFALSALAAGSAHAADAPTETPSTATSATTPIATAAPATAATDSATVQPATDANAAAAGEAPKAEPKSDAFTSEPAGPSAEAAASADSFGLPASDSFSNDDAVEAEQQHRLDLYGFADMTYTRLLIPESSVWNRIYFPANSFSVGNFNLYMSSNLGDGWRALGEVRFMYLPNGATSNPTGSSEILRTDTTVLDYAGFEQPIQWGAIRIERVWVEHEFSALFKLQAGAFLTPYGIWNVDHGSPAIIGIRPPFAIADELFPAHQTGLQLYGNTFFDPLEFGYHLTLSNGRGPVEYTDFSDDKAVGGRLYMKTDAVGSLTVGTSIYRGGYYDRSAKYVIRQVDGQSQVDQEYTTISKYEEFSLGADVKWQWKRVLAQSEFLVNEANYNSGGRPRQVVLKPPQGFQGDYRRWGIYGLLGYRTRILQTMPYVMVQYVYAPDQPIVPPILGWQFGLNIRPTPSVVLKLEYSDTHFYSPGNAGLGLSPLRILSTQVAWAF